MSDDASVRSADLKELKKMTAARRILQEIVRRADNGFWSPEENEKDRFLIFHSLLNSHLLYLIAAADGHDDSLWHSRTVSCYSRFISCVCGCSDMKFLLNMERGALLHDIGKIGIPEFILRKAGSLNSIERAIIEEHPIIGYHIISDVDFLKIPSQVILYHHEYFNGSGYPFGLKGEDIPLEARIFALADTLDALTSDRSYRKGCDFRSAQREIERGSGSQFDPELVTAFLSVPVDRWLKIKNESGRADRNQKHH